MQTNYETVSMPICSPSQRYFLLSARTPAEAVNALKASLDHAISCITNAQLTISRGGYQQSGPGGAPHSIAFREEPIPLLGLTRLYLSMRHQYRVLRRERQRDWKVT